MKPIEKMNYVDKAALLHGLFPDEIPALLEYVEGVCQSLKENEAEERKKGQHALLTFDFWLQLATDTEARIKRYGGRLHEKAGLFADQLFDGHNALFMQYCLSLYVETRQHPNTVFTGIVRLLFDTDKN